MELMILTAVVAANSNKGLKFFGYPISAIRTEQDAVNAVREFCENADEVEVAVTAKELKLLSELHNDFYSQINDILWKVEFKLGTRAWKNHFALLNKHLG